MGCGKKALMKKDHMDPAGMVAAIILDPALGF